MVQAFCLPRGQKSFVLDDPVGEELDGDLVADGLDHLQKSWSVLLMRKKRFVITNGPAFWVFTALAPVLR